MLKLLIIIRSWLIKNLGRRVKKEASGGGHIGRNHLPKKEIWSLSDYRIRYGQYKSDPALQAAHAAFPWIVVPDDHEVKNNWGEDLPTIVMKIS